MNTGDERRKFKFADIMRTSFQLRLLKGSSAPNLEI